jgi:hypothetical protein
MQFIKDKRVELDGVLLSMKDRLTSPEMTLSYRSLQLGRAFLGELLILTGELNTYTPANTPCEIPQAEGKAKEPLIDIKEELPYINKAREILQSTIKDFLPKVEELEVPPEIEEEYILTFIFARQKLTEARIWLGFHLAEMKDQANCE